VDIRASDGVAAFVAERGGSLYVWTSTHRCCSGPLTLLETAVEAPGRGSHAFRRVASGGFDVLLDTGRRRAPRELVLELNRRRTKVNAYWDDVAFVD
jgi:hypothetical protein